MPYVAQTTEFTCGPAAVRMLLLFLGVGRSEEELATVLETNETYGTRRSAILAYLRDTEGLACTASCGNTVRELAEHVKGGVPALVRYIEPTHDEDHYALVIGVTDTVVVLNDPWPNNGQNLELTHDDFYARWTSTYGDKGGWMLAV